MVFPRTITILKYKPVLTHARTPGHSSTVYLIRSFKKCCVSSREIYCSVTFGAALQPDLSPVHNYGGCDQEGLALLPAVLSKAGSVPASAVPQPHLVPEASPT